MSTMTFWDFPWPSASLYCTVLGAVLSIYFVQTLVDAIKLSTRLNNDGTFSWGALGHVAAGYLWVTIVFWAAALGFIAGYKG